MSHQYGIYTCTYMNFKSANGEKIIKHKIKMTAQISMNSRGEFGIFLSASFFNITLNPTSFHTCDWCFILTLISVYLAAASRWLRTCIASSLVGSSIKARGWVLLTLVTSGTVSPAGFIHEKSALSITVTHPVPSSYKHVRGYTVTNIVNWITGTKWERNLKYLVSWINSKITIDIMINVYVREIRYG